MDIRINAGGETYTDVVGNVWVSDDFFLNGSLFDTANPIAETTDDTIYQTERFADSLSYGIPIDNGSYTVTLKFAEIWATTVGQRVFDVTAEGTLIEDDLDLFATGGKDTAIDRTFDVEVTDGELNLDFVASVNNGKVAGIEIVSNEVEPPNPPTSDTVRINVGGDAYTDGAGNVWLADQYFINGSLFSTGNAIAETNADPLYQTERYATNLGYEIPIANGNYTVRLHFAEIFHNDFNQRVFDLSLEGDLILDDFDIFAARKNAFIDGKDSALIVTEPQVTINDGVLNIDTLASVDNAKISAIEIVPLSGAQVLLQQTNGSTSVTEGGNSDSYTLVLNSQPTASVTVALNPSSQISLSQDSVTFTPDNWDVPQSVTVNAVNDSEQEGTQTATVSHSVSSSDSAYNNLAVANLSVTVADDESVAVDFTSKTIANVDNPTTAAWGPDNRLYVGTSDGVIKIYSFDDDYNVTATQTVNTISNQSDSTSILGIAFNPFDNSDSPTIYVSRSNLFVESNEYLSKVSTLSGANFTQVNDVVTGLPVSGFDHGINGMQFDNKGDLLIAVGGNTNTGEFDGVFGSKAPESPLTSAILKAEITNPGYNGNVTYEFVPGTNPPPGADPNDQTYGELVRVAPGSNVSVYASGFRNPYDLVWTTQGQLYATDNGPNGIAQDELNLVQQGNWHGHFNPARALEDSRQGEGIYDPSLPSNAQYTAPLTAVQSSTNGIDEYRANTFGGQLRGTLFAQRYNNVVYNFRLNSNGQQLVDTQTFSDIASGLDLVTTPGGAIVGVDFVDDLVSVAIPNEPTSQMVAYDISTWRASASGGQEVVIGGQNFGTLADTTVTIGSQELNISAVSDQRIIATLPAFGNSNNFLDLTVNSNGATSTIEDAFLPLAT